MSRDSFTHPCGNIVSATYAVEKWENTTDNEAYKQVNQIQSMPVTHAEWVCTVLP